MPTAPIRIKAGVGVVDTTPDVGYCAGQYCAVATDTLTGLLNGDFDPFFTHTYKQASYGVQSRLSARAIVVEGANGSRIALLKTDNYLAQDMLLRRVGQLLDDGDSGIGYAQILHHVTHNHSSAYSSTLAWGVWVFEDMYDARFFEHQARSIARAIEQAAADLRPARLGATEVRHRIYKGNVVRPAVADDGTPAGYPLEYNDHGLVVMRVDDLSDPAAPAPLAAWINWGEHPESLDGYNLHSADFLAALERYVDRALGAPLIFSQGDVGSAENSGNSAELIADDGSVCGRWPSGAQVSERDDCADGEGTLRDWNHKGYVQTERNVRFLADDILRAWDLIGAGDAIVPLSTDFEVGYVNAWVPGPLSHPYPSVSNCRSETTAGGDPGAPVLGLPDCARSGGAGDNALTGTTTLLYATLKAEGVPVPDHYDFTGFSAVEENLRLRLQVFRLGDIVLASCACEAQADLILNLESRLNDVAGDRYNGFDWACLLPEFRDEPQYAAACAIQNAYFDPDDPLNATPVPGPNFAPAAIARMRAQIHNDARGWDAPESALAANSEPAEIERIWGNFTHEEIQDLGVPGYRLAVGIGHAGDYNGYTVSYREYMNRDHYRKALTAYGPHTADYMVTRLVRMAAQLQGGPAYAGEPHDTLFAADEARQQAAAALVGELAADGYAAWQAGMPDDAGSPAPLNQPVDIGRFAAAHFRWRGGSTAVDNPRVRVDRELAPGFWLPQADQTGEIAVRVEFPAGVPGVLRTWAGTYEWVWTASFEAYSAFPARLGSTPPGRYRFCVDGAARSGGSTRPYVFCSEPFTVSVWDGIVIDNLVRDGATLRFDVPDIVYPRSYAGSPFPYIADNGNPRLCNRCSFRPWATRGSFARAEVRIGDAPPVTAQCARRADVMSCSASAGAAPASLEVRVHDHDGNVGLAQLP